MTSDALDVSGGAGGVIAKYDDMRSAAGGLDRIANGLTEREPVIGAVLRDGDLIESAVLSPGTAAQVAAQVTAATVGPHGLVVSAARLQATSLGLTVAVEAYQTLDDALARATTVGQAFATPAVLAGWLETEGMRITGGVLTGDVDLNDIPGLLAQDGKNLLYQNPWLVDGVINNSPAMMWALSAAAGPGGTALLGAWANREGAGFPPLSVQDATGDVVAFGGRFGLFRSGSGQAALVPPTPGQSPLVASKSMTAPTNLSTTMTGISELGRQPGTVRIFDVPQPDGSRRWVVEIPGTQVWSPTAGTNPVDLTNNVRLMAGQQTEQNDAIRKAMRLANIQPGEPVLLAGHSQGGITAASLAADPATRDEFHITNVYTGGAPIAGFKIPDDVNVLSIEHEQDAVPRLDGQDNPAGPNWVTVRRDPTGVVNHQGNAVDDTMETHDSSVYAGTADLVDKSTDPTVVRQRQSFEPFFTGTGNPPGVYQLTRDVP